MTPPAAGPQAQSSGMDKDRIRAFSDRVFADMAGAMTAGMAYLGTRTGLFRAMAGRGPMTLDDVIAATALQRRYVEEWLNGMASAGYLEHDPAAKTYRLPDEHGFLLASEGSDHYMGGLFLMAPVLMRAAPKVADAFVRGGGVTFHEFGEDCAAGLAALNSGTYEQRLVGYWLKALPEAAARLEAGGRALDVGCGLGRVAMTLAKAFPRSDIVGIDLDEHSIRHAQETASGGRPRFIATSTAALDRGAGFDLITAFDCIHDFATPEKTLSEIHALLKPGGTLFVVEPKAADRPEDNRNAVGTMYYGFSLFHCMTQSLANGGPGLGTCMGPARLESLLRGAGFRNFRALDIKSQVNSFFAAQA